MPWRSPSLTLEPSTLDMVCASSSQYVTADRAEGALTSLPMPLSPSRTECSAPPMLHRRIVIDHVELRVRDLEKACAFYQAVLAPLGFSLVKKTNSHASFGIASSRDNSIETSAVLQPEPTHRLCRGVNTGR